jgi:hypothetical protein
MSTPTVQCQPKGVRGICYTKLVLSKQSMMEKWLSSTACKIFFKQMSEHCQNAHAHL